MTVGDQTVGRRIKHLGVVDALPNRSRTPIYAMLGGESVWRVGSGGVVSGH